MKANNKIIAEFMGMNIHHNDKSMMVTVTPQGNEVIPIDSLQYDSSWDLLMPVISKCLVGEAEQSEEISNTTIKNIYEGICNQDISFAYKSVLTFIKNSQHEWR